MTQRRVVLTREGGRRKRCQGDQSDPHSPATLTPRTRPEPNEVLHKQQNDLQGKGRMFSYKSKIMVDTVLQKNNFQEKCLLFFSQNLKQWLILSCRKTIYKGSVECFLINLKQWLMLSCRKTISKVSVECFLINLKQWLILSCRKTIYKGSVECFLINLKQWLMLSCRKTISKVSVECFSSKSKTTVGAVLQKNYIQDKCVLFFC